MISPSEYQAAAQRTECDQLKARVRLYGVRPYVPDELDLLAAVRLNHAVVGMMGEVGEVAQLLEKWVYYGKGVERAKISEELGDILWYLAEACNALGLDLGTIMDANIAKLKARYPEKYQDDLAARENRNLEREEKAMDEILQKPYRPDHPNPFGYNDPIPEVTTKSADEEWKTTTEILKSWEEKLLAEPLRPNGCVECHGTGFHRYPDFEDGTPNFSDSAPCGYCAGLGIKT